MVHLLLVFVGCYGNLRMFKYSFNVRKPSVGSGVKPKSSIVEMRGVESYRGVWVVIKIMGFQYLISLAKLIQVQSLELDGRNLHMSPNHVLCSKLTSLCGLI